MTRLRSPIMVGRAEELRRLREVASNVEDGRASAAVVSGEAGLGKSRLIAELCGELRLQGWLVCVGHGVDLSGGGVPFGVLAETLRDLAVQVGVDRVREAVPAEIAALASLVPSWADPASASQPAVDRGRILSATADLFDDLTAERPICWVLEDLHWVDGSTLDVFSYVARTARGRLLTLSSLRPRADDRSDAFEAGSFVEPIELTRLSDSDTRDQLQGLRSELGEQDQELLVALSEGVPYFVEELAVSWAGSGPDSRSLRRLAVSRLSALSGRSRQLAECASLGDGRLHVALLDRLGFETEDVAAVVAAGILEPTADRELLWFSHALLRDAIEDNLLPGDRRHWHQAWAEAIEQTRLPLTEVERTSALARHWLKAGAAEPAIHHGAQAASDAARASAPREELRHWRNVLGLWDQVEDPEKLTGRSHDEVQVLMFRAGHSTAAPQLWEDDLNEALTRSQQEGDEIGSLVFGLYKSLMHGGYRSRDIDEDRRMALTLLEAPGDARAFDGLANMSINFLAPSELDSRIKAFLQAAAQLSGSSKLRFSGPMGEATIALRTGDFEQGLIDLLRGESSLGTLPLFERWMYHVHVVWFLILLGRTSEARADIERELARLSRPSVLLRPFQMLMENLAHAQVALGDWDDLDDTVESYLASVPTESLTDLRSAEWPVYIKLHRLTVDVARGRPIDRELVKQGWELWGDGWAYPLPDSELASMLCLILRSDGDLAAIRTFLEPAWSLAPVRRYSESLPFAILAALRAETALVDRLDERQLAASREVANRVMRVAAEVARPGPRGAAWWCEAEAHSAHAAGLDTPAQWAAATAAWRACEHPYEVALCLRWQAEAHLMVGDPAGAEASLREAHRIATDLQARPLAEEITALARHGRVQLDVGRARPNSRHTGGLTERELEVLVLVADGLRNEQIATTLYMSPKTASVHVSRILAKLGASTRTEAAAIARRRGLLDS